MTQIEKLTEAPPDNVYFDTSAISWNTENDGNDARFGVIQPGFNETFLIPDSGERIRLHEPDGEQQLIVTVLDKEGTAVSSHILQGQGMVHVMGGFDINVATPEGQDGISYICDYPGVEPGSHE